MKFLFHIILFLVLPFTCFGASYTLKGKVVNKEDNAIIDFATVVLPESQQWATTNDKGEFIIKGVSEGVKTLVVSCLGFVKTEFTITVNKDISNLVLQLLPDNLALEEVVVTAQANKHNPATSYIIDKTALEHQQVSSITDIAVLLPGGKSAKDNDLTSSSGKRFEIRSESGELGNPTFMSAVEVDGVRLSNNASLSATEGIDTRNISTSNIESIEVITGIPSVEYGDVSGGVVKVNTFKGYTPFQAVLSAGPKTKLIALNKGFDLGQRGGNFNASIESTTSTSDMASPHTTYRRNGITLSYINTLNHSSSSPFKLLASVAGNIGGYNSKADPDAYLDTYTKQRDNTIRASLGFDWLVNKPYLTGVELKTFVNYSDKKQVVRTNKSSSTAVPSFHGTEEGYFVATDFDVDPDAAISLIPAGYWYQNQWCDDRPVEYNASLRVFNNFSLGRTYNRVKLGANFSSVGNYGRGVYYDEPLYTPTWRAYPYSEIPFMNNLALYAEDALTIPIGLTQMQITGGVRYDMTKVDGSGYGTIGALSPRISMNYTLIDNPNAPLLKFLKLRAGFGDAVKLPSFAVLYPEPTYRQQLTFAPGALADGTAYYAYYISPSTQTFNPNLKWQRTRQIELGVDLQLGKVRIAVNAYRNKSHNNYSTGSFYNPFTYKFTDQRSIEGTNIPIVDRGYTIDQQTGVVTMYDKTGTLPSQQLSYIERTMLQSNTFATNTSPVLREGIEWVVDFGRIPALYTAFRYDGSYYHYRGVNETMLAYSPSSNQFMADGTPYKYVGYYAGSYNPGNGSETKRVNNNIMVITNIPRIKLLVSLRIEATLFHSTQNLSEYNGQQRGMPIENRGDYIGVDGDIYAGDQYIAIYPEFYTSTDDMNTLIPFKEKFIWASQNDKALYNELSKMVGKTTTSYYFNRNSLSPYFSANLMVTKELGKYFTLSFYANNFLNNLSKIRSSWNDSEVMLYGSSYIPTFNYGISLKVKI